jgi:hypothetical protein
MLVAAALAVLTVPAHAVPDSTGRWFSHGMEWYEHPCGLRAFAKYGEDDTPEVRRAYQITKHQPELCSKLFP